MSVESELNKIECSIRTIRKFLKPKRVFVPKCIKISCRNDFLGSAVLINDCGKCLTKHFDEKTFSISEVFSNDNNGSNYELVKVESIEDGKLYLAYNWGTMDDEKQVFSLYRVGLGHNKYAKWDGRDCMVYTLEWDNVYEVVRIE